MTLLLLLDDNGPPDWWRSDGTRGFGEWPQRRPDEAVAAAAPPAAVALHRIKLVAQSQAQARAAAELMARPVTATGRSVHVAVGRADAEGGRWMAITDVAAIQGWLADCAARGLTPDRLLPAPLLIGPGEDLRVSTRRDELIVRGVDLAFGGEAAMAEALGDGRLPPAIDAAAFEAGLPAVLADPEVDLLQGRFAIRAASPWPWKRLAALAAAIVLMAFAAVAAEVFRANLAETRLRAAMIAEARAALPPGDTSADPVAELAVLAAATADPAHGVAAATAEVAAAIAPVPGVTLAALQCDIDGRMRLLVTATRPAALDMVRPRLAALGYASGGVGPGVTPAEAFTR